jgi:uncharacterized membrane protein YfcA
VFNFSILSAALVAHAIAGLATMRLLVALVVALPVVILTARLGTFTYSQLDDRRFDRVVLALLFFAGIGLILNSVASR